MKSLLMPTSLMSKKKKYQPVSSNYSARHGGYPKWFICLLVMNRSGLIGSWIRELSNASSKISRKRSVSKRRKRGSKLERRCNRLERSTINLLRKKTLTFPS